MSKLSNLSNLSNIVTHKQSQQLNTKIIIWHACLMRGPFSSWLNSGCNSNFALILSFKVASQKGGCLDGSTQTPRILLGSEQLELRLGRFVKYCFLLHGFIPPEPGQCNLWRLSIQCFMFFSFFCNTLLIYLDDIIKHLKGRSGSLHL